MSDKHFIGLDVISFEDTGKHDPISRVTLFLDDENYYTAGDDTGKEITASCPSATQAMADALLAKLKGYQHQSFNADAANIDPAAELGDGVTVSGIYAMLASIKDDGNGYADIGAPDEPEVEEEYPYISPIQQEINRKSTEIYSTITKTAEEIRLEIQGLDDKYVSLAVTLDGVTVTDETGTTKIKGSSIETDTLYVSAANITGTLTANQINLAGAITWNDLSSGVQSNINGAYSLASGAASNANSALTTANALANGTGGGTFINGTTVNSPNIIGGNVTGATINFGTGGTMGSLFYTRGSDGVSTTDLIQLGSSAGIVLYATTNMRFEANSIWMNVDASGLHFKKNGNWVSLNDLFS